MISPIRERVLSLSLIHISGNPYGSGSRFPAGFLPSLYALRGGHRLGEAGAGRKMGGCYGGRPVRAGVDRGLYRIPGGTAPLNHKKPSPKADRNAADGGGFWL